MGSPTTNTSTSPSSLGLTWTFILNACDRCPNLTANPGQSDLRGHCSPLQPARRHSRRRGNRKRARTKVWKGRGNFYVLPEMVLKMCSTTSHAAIRQGFFFFERTLKTIHHTLSQNALSEQQTCRPSRNKIKTGESPVVHNVVHTRCSAICATWTPSLQQ